MIFLYFSNFKYVFYGYKFIQVGKEIFQQGFYVKIGDGKNINVWFDYWILVIFFYKVVYVNYSRNMRVEEFIDKDIFFWNIP